MKLKPRPITTPSKAGRGIHSASPLREARGPRISQKAAVATPAPTTIAGVMAAPAAWVAAAAPIAFIGWTGKGVRYHSPVAIIVTAEPQQHAAGSIFTIAR